MLTLAKRLRSISGRLAKDRRLRSVLLAAGLIGLLGPYGLSAQPSLSEIGQARQSHRTEPIPARLHGIITGFSGWKNSFFLQEATGGISVDRLENTDAHTGDEGEVSGEVRPGLFAPILLSRQIRIIAKRPLPTAQKADYTELATGELDSRLVEVEGIVHAVRSGTIWGKQILFLDLQTSGGMIKIHVLHNSAEDPLMLVDSTVRARGICGTVFNNRQQLVGLRLFVPDTSGIEVVKRGTEPSRLPIATLSSLLRYQGPTLIHRVKVNGAVTYQSSTNDFYLQDGQTPVRVQSLRQGTWRAGTNVTAVGFITDSANLMTLRNAIVIEVSGKQNPVAPVPVKPEDVISVEDGFVQTPYNGRLIKLTGRVDELLPNTEGQLWAVHSGQTKFQAYLAQFGNQKGVALEPGLQVGLTGICVVETSEDFTPKSFRVLPTVAGGHTRTQYAVLEFVINTATTGPVFDNAR